MKIVVGLGNPGSKYEGTRHNVGFDVLAELAHRWHGPKPKARFEASLTEILCGAEKLLLLAPQTFMNLSGRSVQQVVKFYQAPLSDLIVIGDDLNLKVGQIRLRASGSAGGQKGLQSILSCLSSNEICRVRIGIGRPPPEMDAADYVLGRYRKDEIDVIDAATRKAASAVEAWAADGINVAMNRYNGEVESETSD
ncbi:MAG: peptidyl-tRNA hydrolase [Schlesneria sp.]|nr:peptidyl-tRNA hydrolase [Schlesneria sp.]